MSGKAEYLEFDSIAAAMNAVPVSLRWSESDLLRYGARADSTCRFVRAGGRRGAPPVWRKRDVVALFRRVWRGAPDVAEAFVTALNGTRRNGG